MAGIYVHIPFCKSRCVYCGFYSTTQLDRRGQYVGQVCAELAARHGYLKGEDVDTIYLGGGTPTQLAPADIERIFATVHNIYNVRAGAETTVEGNPDDLTPETLALLRQAGVNRLSMGVQTFSDERLRFLNRRHTATQAVQAVRDAQAAGFGNVSIDLMFGFPNQTLDEWRRDVDTAISLGVQHISAYSLMYEDGTPLCKMLERGEIAEADEELSLAMYELLIDALSQAGFEHYEISNFALPRFRSRHNSSYWHGVPYLGVGAGAHSFDGHNRHYNSDSLTQYLAGAPLQQEKLDDDELFNEFVFTGLRTNEGVSLVELDEKFGRQRCADCIRCAHKHIISGHLTMTGHHLRLTRKGLFISNEIMSDFMIV